MSFDDDSGQLEHGFALVAGFFSQVSQSGGLGILHLFGKDRFCLLDATLVLDFLLEIMDLLRQETSR